MKYQCVLRQDEAPARWPAQIRLISRNQTSIEVEIRGRGSSFYVIVGSGAFENYLCIPALDIGCAIAPPDDLFWNSERLSRHLNIVDSTTIATGLRYLDQL